MRSPRIFLIAILVLEASNAHAQGKTSVPTQTHVSGTSGYGIPACLYCPQPKYTRKAADTKLKGPIVLSAVVTSDGRATNISITKSLGHGLDKKAIETVKSWHFRPALGPDGKPANVRQMIEITFPSEPPVIKK